MVSTPPESVEVIYYDPDYRRRYDLETHVPEAGAVVDQGRWVVRDVKWGNGRFRGLRMVYVYLEPSKDR